MKTAVIIPCLNEEASVAKVVADAKKALPQAEIYVLDNGSNDSTAAVASQAGAQVIHEPLRGKGRVLRHAFRAIDADYYVMIDGDGTYPVGEAPRLLKLAQEFKYDMVTGARLAKGNPQAFRRWHYEANRFFTGLVSWLYRQPVLDVLSGFRVFSRRFSQEATLLSNGFEVETELTIRAMMQNLPFCEIDIAYTDRPVGRSKIRPLRDGFRIFLTILRFMSYFRPMAFYTGLAACVWILSSLLSRANQWYLQNMPALFLVLGFYMDARLNLRRMNRRTRENDLESSESKRDSKAA
jgi:glycosyltransferase involved in cell wall biosynthesis